MHLRSGLSKLDEAAVTVDNLSKNTSNEQAKLQEAQCSADAAMEMITKTLADASMRRNEVDNLRREVHESEQATMARQAEIKKELTTIMPILESAKMAVGQIKAEHLNEIRSFKMPPEPIADVLGAVLKLLGISDVSWTSMKKFLGNRGVKDEILNFDAHRISPEMRRDVARILKQKPLSFEQSNITRVSVAAAPLAAWVKANIRYSVILETLEPLENQLASEEQTAVRCKQRLDKCEAEIAEIDERVLDLKNEFGSKTREAEKLRARLELAEQTLDKASELLSKLGEEQERWQEQEKSLALELMSLPRKLLVAAGFVAYLGKYSENERQSKLSVWTQAVGLINMINDNNCVSREILDASRLLATESKLLSWKQFGLPGDTLSRENAVILDSTPPYRVPFVIDPVGAARSWFEKLLSSNERKIEIVQASESRFSNVLELAVRFGKVLLVVDIDFVEPALFPLMRGDLESRSGRFVVPIGERRIDYDINFRLCLMTRNLRQKLPPDITALVSEVNFSVTRSALEDQLLGEIIQHEQPELELKKVKMLEQEEEYKVRLASLETQLLESLATTEGNLLENTILIDSLTQTKSASKEISKALELSAQTSALLDKQREVYRTLASSAASLFLAIGQLVHLNPMYKFSLNSFLRLFQLALHEENPSSTKKHADKSEMHANEEISISMTDNIDKRLQAFSHSLYRLVFYYVGRGLFKDDRPMLALHLVKSMYPSHFGHGEWELFIGEKRPTKHSKLQSEHHIVYNSHENESKNDYKSNSSSVRNGHIQFPGWALTERKQAFDELCLTLPPAILEEFDLTNSTIWFDWANATECEHAFPSNLTCTPFQRLLLTRTFRPDRVMSALDIFCRQVLKVSSLNPKSHSWTELYELETCAESPILLITTVGADPSVELTEFAISFKGAQCFHKIAMGGATQDAALNLLEDSVRSGDWLCLQNLHLVTTWLPILEKKIVAEMMRSEPTPTFRLWLTTEVNSAFPQNLVEYSFKVTFESPPGIKNNIQRTLASWGSTFVHKGTSLRAKLLFIIAWFHAVLQERRIYQPQGWANYYEFSLSDLRAAAFVIDNITNLHNNHQVSNSVNKENIDMQVDFETLHGLLNFAIYGGRIDEPNDVRVLSVYVEQIVNQSVLDGKQVLGTLSRGIPTSFEDMKSVLSTLPDSDLPTKFFGLPDNIDRSVQRSRATCLSLQLRSMSSKEDSASSSTFNRSEWLQRLSPILDLWHAFQESAQFISSASIPSASSSPLEAFVNMEMAIAIEIYAVVQRSFEAIRKVVYGAALLTPSVQELASSLLQHQVPETWSKYWQQGSKKIMTWLTALIHKLSNIQSWSHGGSSLIDHGPIDLTNFFRPAALFSAVNQHAARVAGCAIDQVEIKCDWTQIENTSDFRERKDETITCSFMIRGLLLQGAEIRQVKSIKRESEGYDMSCYKLFPAASSAPEVVPAPIVSISYIPTKLNAVSELNEAQLRLPLYHNTGRDQLLAELRFSSKGNEPNDVSMWILAGTALFLAAEDDGI